MDIKEAAGHLASKSTGHPNEVARSEEKERAAHDAGNVSVEDAKISSVAAVLPEPAAAPEPELVVEDEDEADANAETETPDEPADDDDDE